MEFFTKRNILIILGMVFAAILFNALLQNLSGFKFFLRSCFSVLFPFILGLCLAFIFNLPMRFLETKVVHKLCQKHPVADKLRRPLCLIVSVLFVLSIFIVFALLIWPELRVTIIALAKDLPGQIEALSQTLQNLSEQYHIGGEYFNNGFNIDWSEIGNKIINKMQDNSGSVISATIFYTSNVVSALFRTIMGFAFAIYLLAAKETICRQAKRLAYACLPQKVTDKLIRVLALSNDVFSNFVRGQCTEALILGCLCYIGMRIFSMPYALLISSLIAVTALIPVFGAFIGTGVGALMILLVNPWKALWFVLFIIALQQVESNVIYPRVVGDSVGLPGIWVLVAVTVGGSLWGAVGMLIGVPVCAVLYSLLRGFISGRLKSKKIKIE
ncbi:MAG: AI-2E family transporter [Firmicutes bacterium]|nr:AI-2E family transporter [Bacillota bacterium]